MRKDAKRDAGEREIIEALEAGGAVVTQLSQKGVPDLLCSLNGVWFTVEVKSDRGKLTPDQQAFIDKHNAWVWVVRSKADVKLLLRNV